MSPRRNRRIDPDEPRPISGALPVPAPPGWRALSITRERAAKTYVCPGCDGLISIGTAHIVAWRDGEDDLRRHWHRPCWERARP